ncbi:hypothetical protein E4U42_000498 [Claviceps africana]|uniref:Uncharacterized protein n=1 Tax=Claviceps africana TaxID=83212 RepID=A0A8K0JA66_9HYPO|nr:hypothetical protein E4U42_000498 [Claviceps africana]
MILRLLAPVGPPLYSGTIPEHFAQIVARHGDRPAVMARSPTSSALSETTLTYHMLDLLSNRLASSLASLGVNKGDRVAVSLGNTAEFAALTYACFKLGAVLVPLNPAFQAQQLEAALRHLGVSVLVMGAVTDLAYKPGRGRSNEELLTKVVGDLEAGGRGDPTMVQSERLPSLRKVVVVDNRAGHHDVRFGLERCRALTPYRALLDGSEQRVTPSQRLDAHDTVNIQFTSGTTSAPKAAMLTHHSILNNGILIADRMGLDPTDRIVVPPPLFHCFGCILGYMATATTGAAILFPGPAFDSVATLDMCVEDDATGLYGVTTMFVAVLDALDARDARDDNNNHRGPPARLRKGIMGGSCIPEALMKTIYKRLGLQDLVICYGMTETSPVSCMTSPSHPFRQRCATVGTPMPHTSIKIVDPSDRSVVLPLNTPGELAAAGYLVMKGYYADAAATSLVRVDEPEPEPEPGTPASSRADSTTWLYSGDQATMDHDGFVTITGRIKDVIVRAGENIHPLEVENLLLQHPAVAQASVVGVPDPKLGEAVAAFVIPHRGCTTVPTAGHLQDWVRATLSSHLVPKHVFWVDEFPKTSSGKVQKFRLREWAGGLLA